MPRFASRKQSPSREHATAEPRPIVRRLNAGPVPCTHSTKGSSGCLQPECAARESQETNWKACTFQQPLIPPAPSGYPAVIQGRRPDTFPAGAVKPRNHVDADSSPEGATHQRPKFCIGPSGLGSVVAINRRLAPPAFLCRPFWALS